MDLKARFHEWYARRTQDDHFPEPIHALLSIPPLWNADMRYWYLDPRRPRTWREWLGNWVLCRIHIPEIQRYPKNDIDEFHGWGIRWGNWVLIEWLNDERNILGRDSARVNGRHTLDLLIPGCDAARGGIDEPVRTIGPLVTLRKP